MIKAKKYLLLAFLLCFYFKTHAQNNNITLSTIEFLQEVKTAIPPICNQEANTISHKNIDMCIINKFKNLYNIGLTELLKEFSCLRTNKKLAFVLILQLAALQSLKNLEKTQNSIKNQQFNQAQNLVNSIITESENLLTQQERTLINQIKNGNIYSQIRTNTTNNKIQQILACIKTETLPISLRTVINKSKNILAD